MQKARVNAVKFNLFKRKKKELPSKTVPLKKRASAKTHAAIQFFNGKKSAIDLLEADGRKKFVHSGHVPKDRIQINWRTVGTWAGLVLATAFVAAVMYWGIKQ